jgi:hypothetical protein
LNIIVHSPKKKVDRKTLAEIAREERESKTEGGTFFHSDASMNPLAQRAAGQRPKSTKVTSPTTKAPTSPIAAAAQVATPDIVAEVAPKAVALAVQSAAAAAKLMMGPPPTTVSSAEFSNDHDAPPGL